MSVAIDTSKITFSSAEATAFAAKQIDDIRAGRIKGVPFGVPDIDRKMTPWMPQYLVICSSRPGNGKTSVLINHCNWYSDVLDGIPDNKTVGVYVSWEQSIEGMVMYGLSRKTGLQMSQMIRGDLDEEKFESVQGAGIYQSSRPIFYVGFSDQIQGKRPPMTMDVVHQALTNIRDWAGPNSYKIGPVYLDYLQRIPWKGYESKAVATGAIVSECKDLAQMWSTQVILAAQAKPDADKQDDKQPGNDCIEWTNGADKDGDCNFSLMRPSKYYQNGELVDGTDIRLNPKTSELLMGIQFNKQRHGPPNFREWVMFDVSRCQLKGSADFTSRGLND